MIIHIPTSCRLSTKFSDLDRAPDIGHQPQNVSGMVLPSVLIAIIILIALAASATQALVSYQQSLTNQEYYYKRFHRLESAAFEIMHREHSMKSGTYRHKSKRFQYTLQDLGDMPTASVIGHGITSYHHKLLLVEDGKHLKLQIRFTTPEYYILSWRLFS